jgi:hypothetical protein
MPLLSEYFPYESTNLCEKVKQKIGIETSHSWQFGSQRFEGVECHGDLEDPHPLENSEVERILEQLMKDLWNI